MKELGRMRIVVLVILMLFGVSCTCLTPNNVEEKFLNPLFYETMKKASAKTHFWRIKLTPTQYTASIDGEIIDQFKCKLIKNELLTVTLNCNFYNQLTNTTYPMFFEFNIMGCGNIRYKNCLNRVKFYYYEEGEKKGSYHVYFIPESPISD